MRQRRPFLHDQVSPGQGQDRGPSRRISQSHGECLVGHDNGVDAVVEPVHVDRGERFCALAGGDKLHTQSFTGHPFAPLLLPLAKESLGDQDDARAARAEPGLASSHTLPRIFQKVQEDGECFPAAHGLAQERPESSAVGTGMGAAPEQTLHELLLIRPGFHQQWQGQPGLGVAQKCSCPVRQ